MGKRVRRLSVFLLVAVAALSVQVGLLCRVCKASEPSEEVVARIKKFFSIIDDDGKEFLFPEDAANLDLSDITVGNGYKRARGLRTPTLSTTLSSPEEGPLPSVSPSTTIAGWRRSSRQARSEASPTTARTSTTRT